MSFLLIIANMHHQMRSAALTSLSHRYMALLQNLVKLAYSLKHPPPITYTRILAILGQAGTSERPLRVSPRSLRSFSLKSLTFYTYLVSQNLSPLLKLLSSPSANFFIILLLPPIMLGSGTSLVNLPFVSMKSLLFFSAGTLFQNYSISLGSTCSQQRRTMSMSTTLSCSFSMVYSRPAISLLSSELSNLFLYISIYVQCSKLSFLAKACLMRSSTACMCVSIFLLFSSSQLTQSNRSFSPAMRTFNLLYYSCNCISLVGRFLLQTHISSFRSTSTPSLSFPPYYFLRMPRMRCPFDESRQRPSTRPAQDIAWWRTGKRSRSLLKRITKLQGCLMLVSSSLAKRAESANLSLKKPACCCSLGPQRKSGLCLRAQITFKSSLLSCATARLRPTV